MGRVKPIFSDIFADDSNNDLLSDDPDFEELDFNKRLKKLPSSSAQAKNKPRKNIKSKQSVISNLKAPIKSKGIEQPEQSTSKKTFKYVPTGFSTNCSDEEFND